MLETDLPTPRPTLTSPSLLARVLERIGQGTSSHQDVWRRLTETYAVDLDAVAALMPRAEPEPVWLTVRD